MVQGAIKERLLKKRQLDGQMGGGGGGGRGEWEGQIQRVVLNAHTTQYSGASLRNHVCWMGEREGGREAQRLLIQSIPD